MIPYKVGTINEYDTTKEVNDTEPTVTAKTVPTVAIPYDMPNPKE